jgi:hypothetical protein
MDPGFLDLSTRYNLVVSFTPRPFSPLEGVPGPIRLEAEWVMALVITQSVTEISTGRFWG